jgi:predicted extracellular nuclease
MKQKLLLIATAFVFSQVTNAQVFTSDFETWTSGMPDGWGGSATQLTNLTVSESTDAYSGTKSCQLEVTGTNHRRFSTTSINVTNGTVYQISFWAKGQGEIRTGLLLEPTTYQAYNPYIQVNSGSWTNYTQNITAGGTGSAQFILSIINTVATDHIIIDDLTITEEGTVDPVEPELTTIYDIQYTTDISGDSPLVGQVVMTSGIVTGTYQSGSNYGYFLQDGEGAWNGIHVFLGTTDTRPTIGDELQITGTVAEFNNLTQLTSISETIELSTGNTLPTATVISTAGINTEMYEGVLVKVEGAQCTNVNSGFGMWEITAGGNAAKVHNLMYTFNPTLNTIYNITGVINYSFSEFRICPRSANDITEEGTVDPELTSIYNIQYTTEVSGDSPLVGQVVITSGIVTGTYQSGSNYGYFLQDGEGAWNGIHVFLGTTDTRPTIGDELQITGTVAEFNNLTQLTSISETIELSTGNTLPTATVISTAGINTEMYEGVLVKVEGAQCTNVNSGFGMWEITADGNAAKVHGLMYTFTPTLNTIYNITGVINYSFSEFRICPRSANDITNIASLNEELTNSVKFYPNPASDFISIENALGSTVTISNALGQTVKQTKIENQIEKVSISNLNSGVYFITFMNGQQKTTLRLVVR